MCSVISVSVMLKMYVWVSYGMTHYVTQRQAAFK